MKTKVWENHSAAAHAVSKSCWSVLEFVFFLSLSALAGEKPTAGHAPSWANMVERAYSVDAALLRDDGKGTVTERTKRMQLDKTQVERLKKILQADESYGMNPSACEPVFGARLALHLEPPASAARTERPRMLTLDLCFHCDQLLANQDEENLGITRFGPMRKQLLKLIRDLFPKDVELAAVK